MNIERIRSEVAAAARQFAYVEAHPTNAGGVFVKAAFQTSVARTYFVDIHFNDYPNRMPQVYVVKPELRSSPHRYDAGNICYLHPNLWNPGRHDLTFVLARIAKWLNKYDVYQVKGRWPGAAQGH